jgi:hypothetical protein
LALLGKLLQAILEGPYGLGEVLDAVDRDGYVVGVQIAAEVFDHLGEAPEALCGQEGKDGVRIPSDMPGIHELVRGPSGHAQIVEGLTEFPEQGGVGGFSGLEMSIQRSQFGSKLDAEDISLSQKDPRTSSSDGLQLPGVSTV